MTQHAKIIIVGGGIWGLSAAYHLAKFGAKGVLVLERNSEIAGETTPQAAGLVGQIRPSAIMLRAIQYALELFSQFPKETGHDTGLRQTGSLMVALTAERKFSTPSNSPFSRGRTFYLLPLLRGGREGSKTSADVY